MTSTITLHSFGYRKPKHAPIRSTLEFTVRPDTTDLKAIHEVCVDNCYQNRGASFEFEPGEKWLDLGGNIGAFAVMAHACGVASVVSVEPEPDNLELLRTNVKGLDGVRVVEGCVGVGSGTTTLHLCNTAYNKYRHSTVISKGRAQQIDVPQLDFMDLVEETGCDCVKMDVEGAEIELLEAYGDKLQKVDKMVFEFTFDADPSVARFMAITDKLRQSFTTVHHRKIQQGLEVYEHYPQCILVYCC